jgi:hypothetical protein
MVEYEARVGCDAYDEVVDACEREPVGLVKSRGELAISELGIEHDDGGLFEREERIVEITLG